MGAKNINYSVNSPSKMVRTYDNGKIESQKWNDYRVYKRIETSTYINNGKKRPMSPYSMTREEWVQTPGYKEGRHYTGNPTSSYNEVIFGVTAEFYPSRPDIPDASRRKALNQALSKFKDGGANLPLILAERAQTIGMINQRLLTIAKFALWAKHGKNFRRFTGRKLPKNRTENEIQNLWLELQWGWLPAWQDLYGLMSAFCGNLAWAEVKSVGLSREIADGVEELNPFAYYGTYYYRNKGYPGVTFKFRQKKQFKCTLVGVLDSAGKAQGAALGFSNPAALAWELIPYSCVIDYLLPIGEFLSALDGTSGYSFKAGCMSHSNEWEFDCRVEHLIGTYGDMKSDWQYTTCSHSYKHFKYDREVLTEFPLPSLRIKDPFSVKHAANTLALLTQVFRHRQGSLVQF